jgi:ribonuclease HIII
MTTLNVGDLVYYYLESEEVEIYGKIKVFAIVIKAKNLLKLYDIVIQNDSKMLQDVNIFSLEKVNL